MAIQFPSPVADGYSFTAENGVVYTFDSSGGGGWYAYHPDGLNDVYVNIDGDTMTGDLTVPSLNGGPLAGLRNQIINGDFRIWQRGTSWSTPDAFGGYRSVDRWYVRGFNVNTRSSDAPAGSTFSLETNISASSTNNLIAITQAVELDGGGSRSQFSVGSLWTLSFWLKGTGYSSLNPYVMFAENISNTANRVAFDVESALAKTGETSNGFERYSVTYKVPSTALSSSIICVQVGINLDVANISSPVKYAQVQLEPGPVATPLEIRPIGLERQLCERYFQKVGGVVMPIATGFITGGNASALHISYKTEMRAVPTITSSGTTNDYTLYGEGAPRTITRLPYAVLAGTTDAQIQVDGTAFPGAGTNAMLRIAQPAGAVNFDAEL